MTIPDGYMAFARANGMNPYHPLEWTPEQTETFMRFKRQHVQARHQARIADGTWALMSDSQRETARRDDETMATAPPPSQPYKICPCHSTPRQRAEEQTPPPKGVTEALAFIARFAPGRPGDGA